MDQYNYHFTQDWNHVVIRISSLIDAKQLQEAEELALTTLKLDPNNPNLLNAYGVVLQLQQRFDDSIKVLAMAAEGMPNDYSIWFNTGITYVKCQNYEKALACFDKALNLDQTNLTAWSAKSQIYIHLNDYPQALAALNQALAISPKNLNLLRSKAIVLQNLSQYNQLIKVLEEISALDPTDLNITQALDNLRSQLPQSN